MNLPPDIVAILTHFAPLFTTRTWPKAQLLTIGALLTIGRRTVASALRIMGRGHEPDYTNYHRLLNRDAWSCRHAGRILLGLILAVPPPRRLWCWLAATPSNAATVGRFCVTFAELRRHPSLETPGQWSDMAIARTTPVLMGLFSVVSVLAVHWHGRGELTACGSAWYAKGEPTFSDCLALTRRKIWRARNQVGSAAEGDVFQFGATRRPLRRISYLATL